MKLKYVNNEDQHKYYLDGKQAKGVTTVASIPDNRFNLERHGKRMVAIGLAMNPVLVEAVAAHFDDKNEVDGYVNDAYIAAKAAQGADRGTAVHRFTERHDLDEPIIETPLATYVIGSWKAALEATDLEVLTEYVERIVVYPDRRICGRLDRIVRNRTTGVLYVADVKGGENAIRYPHSMACQVGLYANAPLIAGPIPSSGGETTTFDPMPDVNKDIGYIFHLPESGDAAVATVDIAGGWLITTRAIFPILDWRDRKDLCQPVAKVGGGDPVNLPAAVPVTPAVDVGGGEPASESPPVEQAPPADAPPFEGGPADPAAVTELKHKFEALTDDQRAWIGAIFKDAKKHKRSLSLAVGQPSQRKYWIGVGMLWLATTDHTLLEAALTVANDADTPGTGEHLSLLSSERAALFAFAAEQLAKGGALILQADGTARIQAA